MDQSSSLFSGGGVSVTHEAKPAGPLTDANRQWTSRPDDQRFETLAELSAAAANRRGVSKQLRGPARGLVPVPIAGDIGVEVNGGTYTLNHWSMGQLSSFAGAPAAYLRDLPAELAVDCLRWGMHKRQEPIMALVAAPSSGALELRAVTGPDYGRIWDAEVIESVARLVERQPQWRNPPDWSGRPSGLYASDHDVFIFMVDGGSVLEEPGGFGHRPAQLHRGFIVSNSEVGAAAFRLVTFLFRVVCGNHLIWDPEDVTRLVVRHTKGGPGRFDRDAGPTLARYAQTSARIAEQKIAAAMQHLLPKPEGRDDKKLIDWLRLSPAKLTTTEAKETIELARKEEGDCRSVWQAVQGATAYARTYRHTDTRTNLEQRAGRLMEVVK